VILLTLLALAAVSSADTDQAAVDVSALRAWQGRSVATLELAGLPDGLEGSARPGLALTPRRKLWKRHTTVLTTDLAVADARRLRLLMARHGFPDSRITASARPIDDESVAVVLHVAPGPEVTYGEVSVTTLPAGLSAQADSVCTLLPRGQRFDDEAVENTRRFLILAQQRAGHAHPEVELAVSRDDEGHARLVFECRPGQRFRYDGLLIDGVPADLERLAHRTIDLHSGTPFTPAVATRARKDLRRLRLFRQVRLVSEARTDTTLDLVVNLRPRRMITLETSVGSFTDDWLVAELGLTHRNLLGGGRGGRAGLLYSTHRREAEARLWWPGLMSPRSRTELTVSGEIQDEESYRLDTGTAELATVFESWTAASLRVSLAVSHGDLDDRSSDPDAFVDEVGLLTCLGATWYRDTSDHPMDPRRGSRLTVKTEWSPPGTWTDTPFASARVFGSRYWPLGWGTLALRLDGGLAGPLGDTESLRPDRRFFAGGVSTMRGYRRHELGPTDSDNQAVGGEIRLLLGGEVRLPLAGPLGLAVFVDSGQVWATRDDVDLSELAVAAGAGLMVGTPVGPIRLDLSANVTEPANDTSTWLLSLAVGHPF